MEELQDNLLFRWFVGPDLDAPVWDVTVFTTNRNRLLAGDVVTAFFERVLTQAKAQRLLSDEHFTVDGMLIEAWAGQKSFKKKTDIPLASPTDDPSNPSVDFRASGGPMPRMPRPLIRKPGCTRRRRGRNQTVLLGVCADEESAV